MKPCYWTVKDPVSCFCTNTQKIISNQIETSGGAEILEEGKYLSESKLAEDFHFQVTSQEFHKRREIKADRSFSSTFGNCDWPGSTN